MLTPSTMPPLHTPAPDFRLFDTNHNAISLANFSSSPALLVTFISTHCPYTKHILSQFVSIAKAYSAKGLAVIAINSNDPLQHTEDEPDNMAKIAEQMNLPFPYLHDGTQVVAKAYQAACTPDFFLYDKDRRLFYRGRFDDSRPDNDIPVTGEQLLFAINAVLNDEPYPQHQSPSLGCNIKWKPGNEPEYFIKELSEESI